MLILTHVIIALSSIAFTTHLWFSPTRRKFYVSYGLIAATLISGTALVISTHSPLLSSCETGLAYLGIVLAALVAARRRLAHDSVSARDEN